MLSLICVLHCLWEADCRLAGEKKKKVSGLGSPSTFPEAEASCSHTFAAVRSRALLGPSAYPHPSPLSPGGKPAWGAPVFAHVALLSCAPVRRAAGHRSARGICLLLKATAIFSRAEGSCITPTSPAAKRVNQNGAPATSCTRRSCFVPSSRCLKTLHRRVAKGPQQVVARGRSQLPCHPAAENEI